ncbi:biotin--[acetyl-CoA-carboxylase] ligase [Chitinispirillales bacterium ANBcel5]|uniref:biotin--[acetyl-CoA-carboxylase] ligase n=1 Tax=Cellulosispirillum alkaliphilum TaxID=3039283 RepID=UPI002A57E109|nr:biotin--[acetyl-CoA-carboxylase] ligase [Chitinispirillales bacterium ANBcel5]
METSIPCFFFFPPKSAGMSTTLSENGNFIERIYAFPSIDSTNEYAKKLSSLPQNGVFIIKADVQTCGKGRRGKSFFSSVRGGLWVSIISPIEDISLHFSQNRAISLAICNSILKYYPDAPIRIKWPNDIYWNDKKIAGILLEPMPQSTKHIIIGFGLNVNISETAFPDSLKNIASSLLIESNQITPIDHLLKSIAEQFCFLKAQTVEKSHSQYKSLLYRAGKPARINGNSGIFESVTNDGFFELKTQKGIERFASGTVSFSF